MTTAVCLCCGNFKFGAFVPCDHCGHMPTDKGDRLEQMLFTDQAMSDEFLRRVSAAIQRGETINLDGSGIRAGAEDTAELFAMMLALHRSGQPLPPEVDRMLQMCSGSPPNWK